MSREKADEMNKLAVLNSLSEFSTRFLSVSVWLDGQTQ